MTDIAEDLAAAEDRVAAFLDALARLPDEAFVSTSLPAPSPETDAAVAEATRLAASHGLADLLAMARSEGRGAVLRRYDAGGYRPTMAGLNWGVSEGRAQDRVAGVVGVEDAISAAVVEPRASEALLTTLASRYELIQRGGDVAPTFDLSAATARRIAPLERGAPTGLLVVAVVAVVAVLGSVSLGVYAGVALAVILAAVAVVARRPTRG